MSDSLADSYPRLAACLPKIPLADLPTPITRAALQTATGNRPVLIKDDGMSGALYGGNKVRKLEYLLYRARDRGAQRVATFGTVGSNHALATALYAGSIGLPCTCLLLHQTLTPNCAPVLNMHLQNGTELVAFGGSRAEQVDTMRRYLRGRECWVVPAGGSSWLGAIGFVNAALELAAQLGRGEFEAPDCLYVANGTMGTAAGLALGLALAGLPTEVHAIRVTYDFVANRKAMRRLIEKTAALMHRYDPSVPADLSARVRYRFRDEFFAGGYAKSNAETDLAVVRARDELGLALEPTYTGKAMAALLRDHEAGVTVSSSVLFWNTYNSRPLAAKQGLPGDCSALPDEFLRYFG